MEHREFGLLTAWGRGHLNPTGLLGHPLSTSELWLLEAVGWLFYSSHGDVRGRLAFG